MAFRADLSAAFCIPLICCTPAAEFAARWIRAADLPRVENEAIRDVIALEQEIGFGGFSDGEFRGRIGGSTSSR